MRIADCHRPGSSWGKRLAIFFGLLVVVAGLSGGVYALWNQKPVVEVTVAQKSAAGLGGREALLNASGYGTPRPRATIAAKTTALLPRSFSAQRPHAHAVPL